MKFHFQFLNFGAIAALFLCSLSARPAVAVDPCDQFAKFLEKTSPSQIDDLLKDMAHDSQWSEYLKHYTFMFKSKSLQVASPTNPRAIVYGPDAKMIMTFLKGPDSLGEDAIELSCWRGAAPVSTSCDLSPAKMPGSSSGCCRAGVRRSTRSKRNPSAVSCGKTWGI